MATATWRRCRSSAWALGVAVAATASLSACAAPAIGQTHPTQLALFCIVHLNDTKHALYALVGDPTVSGNEGAATPPVFRAWHVPYTASSTRSWAAWMGQTGYLVSFEHNHVVRIDQRTRGRTTVGWTC